MSIALLVITDGRDDCLDRCLASAEEQLRGPISERWMHDDTGDPAYREGLTTRYPQFWQLDQGGPRLGFGGAIRHAWTQMRHHSLAQFVLHVEGDFVFTRPVDLAAMVHVLTPRPHLAHLALRRQPWNPSEIAAGGVVERTPEAFTDRSDGTGNDWLEHRLFFTTNPSLYRRSLCRLDWPSGAESEGRFTQQLLRHGTPDAPGDDVAFGYWGDRTSGVWVEHIGHQRVGMGY